MKGDKVTELLIQKATGYKHHFVIVKQVSTVLTDRMTMAEAVRERQRMEADRRKRTSSSRKDVSK